MYKEATPRSTSAGTPRLFLSLFFLYTHDHRVSRVMGARARTPLRRKKQRVNNC